MKIYLAGPMSNLPSHNYPAFREAATRLRGHGFNVVSPAELHAHAETMSDAEACRERTRFLRADIIALLGCDTVALLHGWEQSEGALVEVFIASALRMRVLDASTLQTIPPLFVWRAVSSHAINQMRMQLMRL